MLSRSVLTIVLTFVIGASMSAEVYKWTDEHGHVHYGQQPPENVESVTVYVDIHESTGTQFASEKQIQEVKQNRIELSNQRKTLANRKQQVAEQKRKICSRKRDRLRKIEAYLKHTYNLHDERAAKGLRAEIKADC